jgi:hypothetical protein
VTSGDTLLSLLEHVVVNGGNVAAITTLADGLWQNKLRPEPKNIAKILDRAGLDAYGFEREFGFPITQLSGGEAHVFANLKGNWSGVASLRAFIRPEGGTGVFEQGRRKGAQKIAAVESTENKSVIRRNLADNLHELDPAVDLQKTFWVAATGSGSLNELFDNEQEAAEYFSTQADRDKWLWKYDGGINAPTPLLVRGVAQYRAEGPKTKTGKQYDEFLDVSAETPSEAGEVPRLKPGGERFAGQEQPVVYHGGYAMDPQGKGGRYATTQTLKPRDPNQTYLFSATHAPQGFAWAARIIDGRVIELNAAYLAPSEVPAKIEHEIGHLLFEDRAMWGHFETLWGALSADQRAAIEATVAKSYDKTVAPEETRVRALEEIRKMATAAEPNSVLARAWQAFVRAVALAWSRLTGQMPSDPQRLAARMVEIGVNRFTSPGLAVASAAGAATPPAPLLVLTFPAHTVV